MITVTNTITITITIAIISIRLGGNVHTYSHNQREVGTRFRSEI
jgi:hypothetical protein